MGDITENFSFHEFKVSERFPELAAAITLTKLDKHKIFWLVQLFLQPIRDAISQQERKNFPITVGSGIRSRELNSKVGGVVHSDHLFRKFSCASDIKLGTKENNETRRLWQVAYRLAVARQEFFKQFILYLPSAGDFIHISLYDGGGKRGQLLFCASRDGRAYFNTYEEADNYQRGMIGG